MKVVILGANGMLGHDLTNNLKKFDLYPLGKEDLDITKKSDVKKKIKSINPDFVINSSGYTDVDGCESNPKLAFSVNAEGVRNIAESCNDINCTILHISTDYVFDGSKDGYNEEDKPNPINVYGKSKLLGEEHLKKFAQKFYIIRTSWMYGENGKNFVDTIIKLSKTMKEIKVVNDQKGSPTYTKDLSEAIKDFLHKKQKFGVYHWTNSGVCTWFEFATKIIEIKNIEVDVIPISSEGLKRPAARPKFSVMTNSKLPALRNWQSALKDYLTA